MSLKAAPREGRTAEAAAVAMVVVIYRSVREVVRRW